jgi:ATP:ADP antiporter, AAA family
LPKTIDLRAGELRPVLWSGAYFFCLLACNYILRALRDAMGVQEVKNLSYLYTGTFVVTLIVSPGFFWLVARFPRRRFIPIAYRFLALTLLGFFTLLRVLPAEQADDVQRAFFVWMSVFNLFAVSVFWGFMADVFRYEQGKRLFGLVGAGGTLGAISGSLLTRDLVAHIGAGGLLLIAILSLELAVQCVLRLARDLPETPGPPSPASAAAERPQVFTGLKLVLQRPYLRILCLFMALQTISATYLYFERANLLSVQVSSAAGRTSYLANIDLYGNLVCLLVQVFATSRIIRTLGIALTLCLLPLVSIAGFVSLGFALSLDLITVFNVLSRATEFSTVRPARETLYTVVSRAEKYQSKSFIDTFVYRGGDALGSWMFKGLLHLKLELAAIAFAAVPIGLVWMGTAFALGRRQEALARERSAIAGVTPARTRS